MIFEDIAIVDLDLPKTTWSRVHSSMRTLYLRLTREPDIGWGKFFHEERESRIVLKRHGLWLEDGYIVFDCLLEDVEEYHLPDFRLSVAYANQKYRELLAERREQGEQQRDDARAEQDELAALRDRIRVVGGSVAPAAAAIPKLAQAVASTHADFGQAIKPPPAQTPSSAPAKEVKEPARPEASAGDDGSAAAMEQTRKKAAPDTAISAASSVMAVEATPKKSGAAITKEIPIVAAVKVKEPTRDDATTSTPAAIAAVGIDKQSATDGLPVPAAQSLVVAPPAPSEETAPAHAAVANPDVIAGFDAIREEWRARFRAALASRPKEPDRGNN